MLNIKQAVKRGLVMAFGAKKTPVRIGSDQLAAIAGGSASIAVADGPSMGTAPVRRNAPPPDLSKMRPNVIEETAEQRKRRLAAKTVNFTATIIARLIIIGAAGYYAWHTYQFSGQVHRGVGFGIFAMVADLGRVTVKSLTPGSK